MKRVLLLTVTSAFLAACSHTHYNKADFRSYDEGLALVELSERIGTRVILSAGEARYELSNIQQRALSRYSSSAPRDTLNIKLSNAIYATDSIYNMRDVSITIARGDSRQIVMDDVDMRFSGVSTNLRVTYAENQKIYINGRVIGVYDPNRSQIADANVSSGEGNFSARVTY